MEYNTELPGKKYQSGQDKGKRKHYGQLKLALSFLHILNFACLKQNKDYTANIFVSYVGASPGQYMGTIMKLFPNMYMETWDPTALRPGLDSSPVQISKKRFSYNNGKIIENRKLFTDEEAVLLADKIKEKRDKGHITIFISDIRRPIDSKTPKERAAAEMMIKEDMEMQRKWAMGVSADWTQLKFRLPYSYISKVPDYEIKEMVYFGGSGTKIFYQSFPPLLSTETRMYVPRKNLLREKTYDTVKYEEQLFYHNTKIRETEHDPEMFNTLISTKYFDRLAPFQNCDKYWALMIIAEYVRKVRKMRWNTESARNLQKEILEDLLRVTVSK